MPRYIEPSAEDLVGREAELELLRACLEHARAGRGGIVVLAGEAGIGKTTLAGVLASEAAERDVEVGCGRAWEFAEAPPYFPLWPCLRALGITDSLDGAGQGASATDAFQLWERVLAALAQAASRRPVLWVLDDLHVADVQTADLLLFLARPLRSLAALVLLTRRANDLRTTAPLEQRLTRLARDGTLVDLGPLAPSAAAQLATRVARTRLAPAALSALVDRAGGNPLFVVECARAADASSAAWSPTATLPQAVAQTVAERIAHLPSATQALLGAGAVLGREFVASTVARMHATLAATVIDALLPALRAGILAELSPGRFRFSHALVRDAVYAAVPAATRQEAHACAADALGSLGDAPDVLVERAHHALAGLRPATSTRAVALAERAVAALEAVGGADRAFALYTRVLEAREGSLELSPPDAASLSRAAALADAAGRFAESRALCERALASARAAGDAEAFARAALAFGAALRPGVVDGALVRILEDALSCLGGAPSALRCRLEARLAAALQPADDPAVPVARARAVLADARASGDADLVCDVLYTAGSAMIDYVDPRETRALAGELLDLAATRRDAAKMLRAHARVVVADADLGDFAALELDLERMLDLAKAVGHPRFVWRALLLDSMRAVARGRFSESERLLVEVEQLAGVTDDPTMPFALAGHRLFRAAVTHDPDEFRTAMARLDDVASRMAGGVVPGMNLLFAAAHAFVYARLGDSRRAADALARVPWDLPPIESDLFAGVLVAEACALVGPDAQRRRMRALLARSAHRDVTSGHLFLTYEGPVARVVGLLDAALGDTDAAERGLRDALDRVRARGLRPWVARIAFELGDTLRAAGRHADAARPLAEAAELAIALGMPTLAARASRALAAGPAGNAALAAAREAPAPAAAPSPTVDAGGAGFALESAGESWWVSYAGHRFAVRDNRGLQLLARLVERPGEEIHVLVLASDGTGSLGESHAGEALDARAVREYRTRLSALDDEIARAEALGDGARAARFAHERDFLAQEISRAVGLGGNARRTGSASERARINVQRRLRDALARIRSADAEAGRYLDAAVRTGTFCSFRP